MFNQLILLLLILFSCNRCDAQQTDDSDQDLPQVLYNSEDKRDQNWSHLEAIAKLMSQSMRSIANEELAVTHMQHIYDQLAINNIDINFETIIDDMTAKVCLVFILILY